MFLIKTTYRRGFLILHSLKYNQFFQFLKPQLSIFFDYLINDRSFISALLPPPPFFPFLLCANHRWMLNITPQHKIKTAQRQHMQRHFTRVQSGEKTGGDALHLSRFPTNPAAPATFCYPLQSVCPQCRRPGFDP